MLASRVLPRISSNIFNPCAVSSMGFSSTLKTKVTQGFWFSSSATPQPSKGDLLKLVEENEELLKVKEKEIDKLKDELLRNNAEIEKMQIDLAKTMQEASESKERAVQIFSKSLLEVRNNLKIAYWIITKNFYRLHSSNDTAGVRPLISILRHWVLMSENKLLEVINHPVCENGLCQSSVVVKIRDPKKVEKYNPKKVEKYYPDGFCTSKPAGAGVSVLSTWTL